MPPLQSFAAETWAIRGTTPGMILNGVYSGIVGGPFTSAYDPLTRTMQVFSIQAHHFEGFANMACISFDDGATFALTFNEDANVGLNETCVAGWSMPHPSIPNRSVHVQVRVAFSHAFLIASGDLKPGGISLWVSDGGASFFKWQDLYSWPAVNAIPVNTGGHAGFSFGSPGPTFTAPILIAGSGPDGEDAYWMIASYRLTCGGTTNPTVFSAADVWRSLDGLTWEKVRDITGVPQLGLTGYGQIVESTSGRLLVIGGAGPGIHYTDEDLLTGSFTSASVNGVITGGRVLQMYGSTFFTHAQGTLTGPGSTGLSCDDGANWFPGGVVIVPQNRGGACAKLGPTEILHVAPGFSDPATETSAYYSNDSGETFQVSEPWLVSGTGELPVGLDIRSNGTPIVVCRGGKVYVSGDKARGVAGTRTQCPLANAGLAAARKLVLCGGVLSNICDNH